MLSEIDKHNTYDTMFLHADEERNNKMLGNIAKSNGNGEKLISLYNEIKEHTNTFEKIKDRILKISEDIVKRELECIKEKIDE